MSLKKDFFKLLHKIKSFILQRQFKSFKDNYFKNNFSKTKKLIMIFVPSDTDRINGGILSICTIHSVIKELKHIHNCDVVASFLPFKNETDYKYRNFENDMIIFTFKEIATYFKDLEFVEIHIPDVMITTFKKENKKMLSFFKWVEQLAMVKVNILNQNDLFMPPSEDIENLKNIFPDITMTVAHEQYLTPEKREYYGMPIHQLSPWLSPIPYKKRKFAEKENLILYSPDKIQSVPISQKSTIGNFGNSISQGCNIMTGTVITSDIHIERGVIVNLNTTIGHDSVIGEFVELSPGVSISGNCSIGSYTTIGTNATILPKITIGSNVIVAAGAVVTKDVPNNCMVAGIPAIIKKELPPLNL